MLRREVDALFKADAGLFRPVEYLRAFLDENSLQKHLARMLHVEKYAGGAAIVIARIERGHCTPEGAQRLILERPRFAAELFLGQCYHIHRRESVRESPEVSYAIRRVAGAECPPFGDRISRRVSECLRRNASCRTQPRQVGAIPV